MSGFDNFYLLKQAYLSALGTRQLFSEGHDKGYDSITTIQTGYLSPQALQAMQNLSEEGKSFNLDTFKPNFNIEDLSIALKDLQNEAIGLDSAHIALNSLIEHQANIQSIMDKGGDDLHEQLLEANIELATNLQVILTQEEIVEMISDDTLEDDIQEDQFRASLGTFIFVAMNIAENNGVDIDASIDQITANHTNITQNQEEFVGYPMPNKWADIGKIVEDGVQEFHHRLQELSDLNNLPVAVEQEKAYSELLETLHEMQATNTDTGLADAFDKFTEEYRTLVPRIIVGDRRSVDKEIFDADMSSIEREVIGYFNSHEAPVEDVFNSNKQLENNHLDQKEETNITNNTVAAQPLKPF